MSGDESTPISENGCEVYVRGLPADVTEDDLNSAFAGYGTLEKVRVKSRPKGSFAFLLFSDGAGASAAIDAMNDKPFKYALPPPPALQPQTAPAKKPKKATRTGTLTSLKLTIRP